MKPIALFLTLAALAAGPALAQNDAPSCPANAGGGQTTNWGPNSDVYVQDIFQRSLQAAGITQEVRLIPVNVRRIDGSPISALPKGTPVRDGALPTDAVVYGFGLFEIVCDQAQLGTFMLHEMRHLKKGDDGKTHFERVLACRKEMIKAWAAGTDLSAYPDDKAALAEFTATKGAEVQTKCVAPVEAEADKFAFATLPKLGFKSSNGPDPSRDARAQSFKNADLWAKALGDNPCDPGHGCLGARAKQGADFAKTSAEDEIKAREKIEKMSLARPGD